MGGLALVIGELLKEGVGLLRDYRDPQKRKELISIAKSKYGDRALFTANDIISLARQIKLIGHGRRLLRNQKDQDKEVEKLDRKEDELWKDFERKDGEFRRLLIKE